MNNNPILNSPYKEPKLHYHTNDTGELDYEGIQNGNRVFLPNIHTIPTRQGAQKGVFEINDLAGEYEMHLVNLIRKEIKAWRENGYLTQQGLQKNQSFKKITQKR